MKTALQILMLLLGAAVAGAALVGLVGIDSSVAFLTSEAAFWLYAVAGLMLIGFTDYTYRRPIVTRAVTPKAGPIGAIEPGRRGNAYGIRRRNRIAA